MTKSIWLNRPFYFKKKLDALYSLKDMDIKQSEKLENVFPEKQKLLEISETISRRSNEKYTKLLEDYNNIRKEVENAIEKIDDFELQALLIAHYLENKSWKTIATENYYGVRTVKYKHLKALDCLEIPI